MAVETMLDADSASGCMREWGRTRTPTEDTVPKVTHGKRGVGYVTPSMHVVDRDGVRGVNECFHHEQSEERRESRAHSAPLPAAQYLLELRARPK